MEFLQDFNVPVVTGICLCAGYIIKHGLSFIPNKFIPLIMAVLGLVINILINLGGGAFMPPKAAETVLAGLFSGLASTGMHNAFKEVIGGDDEEG
jgi:hypothetical protein